MLILREGMRVKSISTSSEYVVVRSAREHNNSRLMIKHTGSGLVYSPPKLPHKYLEEIPETDIRKTEKNMMYGIIVGAPNKTIKEKGERTMNINKTVAKVFSNNTSDAILVSHYVGHEYEEGNHKDYLILKGNKAAVLKHCKELSEKEDQKACACNG